MGIDLKRASDVGSSVMASTFRGWRGAMASRKVQQPEQLLELYDREGCAHCRFVREALTELNLDVRIVPVPLGGQRNLPALKRISGRDRVPFLYDPNNSAKIEGSDAIIAYLFNTYAGREGPKKLRATKFNVFKSRLATVIRGARGLEAKPSVGSQQDLTLYSFEASPYSRPVRERLCELELPYKLINIGKQQRADIGPSNFRLHFGEYKPIPNTKRSAFMNEHGNVQVPYLIDPNTQRDLFESADILRYLSTTYQVGGASR